MSMFPLNKRYIYGLTCSKTKFSVIRSSTPVLNVVSRMLKLLVKGILLLPHCVK